MVKSKIIFIIILFVLSVVYIGGCRRAAGWLVREEVPEHADAMVLLMGSFPSRVLQAVDLYNQGKAGKILIAEENRGTYRQLEERGVNVLGTTAQARDALITLGIPADSIIILPADAQSTLTEILTVRHYLADNPGIDSLIIVSSPTHMRRSLMIFRKALKKADLNVYAGCSPSAYSGFNPDKWWHRKEDIQVVLTEYIKIGSFILIERKNL